jgi:hypothetical protein
MHNSTFQNCAATTIAFIDSARSSLSVAICWFTHPAIFNAVRDACSRNVRVKIVLDYDHINFHPRGLDFTALEKAGATVLGYTGPGLLHYKFAVADSCCLLTGSYNWTRAEQCDHLTIIQDPALAAQFSTALAEITAQCQPLAQLRNIPPRQISFSQLYRPTLWSIHDLRKGVVSGAKTWLVVSKTGQEWQRWTSTQRHCLPVKCSVSPWVSAEVWDEQSFRRWLLIPSIRPATRQLLTRYCLRVQQGDILIALTPTGALLGAGIVGAAPEILAEMPEVISRFVQWLMLKESPDENALKFPNLKGGITRYKGSALELIAAMESLI